MTLDEYRLANGLSEFFNELDETDDDLEFDSYDLQGKDRVDVMIDTENILIESNSLKAVRHIKYKCIDSGYILKRDKEIEKVFKKNKVGRYLRVYSIIGTENHLCYS